MPTQLFIKPNFNDKVSLLWEIFFGFWLIVNGIFMITLIIDGDHLAIPINLLFTYILLTLRAGQVSKFQ